MLLKNLPQFDLQFIATRPLHNNLAFLVHQAHIRKTIKGIEFTLCWLSCLLCQLFRKDDPGQFFLFDLFLDFFNRWGGRHLLDRCFLQGRLGDKLNLIGSASGFNMLKLLRLLGTGIFSRALLGFRHFLLSVSRFLGGAKEFLHACIGGSLCQCQ